MKRSLIRAAVIVALAFACTVPAAEPRVGKYVKYDAGEFVIVTSRSAGQARRFIDDLAKFRLTLERALGKRATKSDFPTTIVITSASDWRTWLQPRENVAGFFQRARFANYLALNGDAPPDEALAIVFHEYTHYYLASQFAGEYPPMVQRRAGRADGLRQVRAEQSRPADSDGSSHRGARRRLDTVRSHAPRRSIRSGVSVSSAGSFVLCAGVAHGALRHGGEPRLRQADHPVHQRAQQTGPAGGGGKRQFRGPGGGRQTTAQLFAPEQDFLGRHEPGRDAAGHAAGRQLRWRDGHDGHAGRRHARFPLAAGSCPAAGRISRTPRPEQGTRGHPGGTGGKRRPGQCRLRSGGEPGRSRARSR